MKLKRCDIDSGFENFMYQTSKSWQLELEDGKRRQFGLLYSITDMKEATGDDEYNDYPFLVSVGIIAHKPHSSFNESDYKTSLEGLRFDCNSYMGTVPVDHILANGTKRGHEPEDKEAFDILVEQFSAKEAKVVEHTAEFGTYAAQYGRKAKHQYLQFKTQEAAEKFCQLLSKRTPAIGVMIGFILDRPINLMGDSGWSLVETMVHGSKYNRNKNK